MNPKIWGPHAWIFLHSITFNYPSKPTLQDINHYKNFFNNLKYILPCNNCQNHYKNNIDKYPLTDEILSSKQKLINWLINIHVDKSLHNTQLGCGNGPSEAIFSPDSLHYLMHILCPCFNLG